MKHYEIAPMPAIPRPRNPSMPHPPPINNGVININIPANNGGMSDAVILSAFQQLNNKILQVESHVAEIEAATGLELGELSGMAYPGDKGHSNAVSITMLNNSLLSMMQEVASMQDSLIGYATIADMNRTAGNLSSQLMSDFDGKINDVISGNIDMSNVSGVVSALVSSYLNQEEEDYTDILNKIETLNNDF